MSSASSYSSDATRSFSSFTDLTEAELRLDGESITTDPDSSAEGTPSFCLPDSSGKSGSARFVRGSLPAATVAGIEGDHEESDATGLLRNERIHRYIDQCVPFYLIAHQRATDGRALVQRCEALVEFGGPERWGARLPSNIFSGSVCDPPPSTDHKGDNTDAACDLAACMSVDTLYCSEDVTVTWEEDMQRNREDGFDVQGNIVPWDSLARHLHQRVSQLNQLITRESGHYPIYILPFRLQARVTPVLYAWATCWQLIEADVKCWESVVRAFHAACGAHQPPKDGVQSSSFDALPVGASPTPLPTTSTNMGTEDLPADAHTQVKCSFTLPWKPLAALFLGVLDPSNSRLLSWATMVSAVRRELPALCRRASPFFTAEAVDGVWGLICGDLQRAQRGVVALSLFVQLVPYRHLCEVPTARQSPPDSEENSKKENGSNWVAAATSNTPRLTTRARHILHFLLIEAAAWSPPTPPSSPITAGPKRGKRKGKTRRLLMPWRNAVMFFVSSLARAHPSVEGLGDYAEPLFTAWLNALALPIGSSVGLVGARSAAAVSHIVRGAAVSGGATGGRGGSSGGDRGSTGDGGSVLGQHGAAEVKTSQIKWSAVLYVRLLNAFPDNAESSLWRQLERWIHATNVLVRPGLPCSPGSAAERVCKCYYRLAREALRRVPRRNLREERDVSGHRQDATRGSDLTSSATGLKTEGVPSTTGAASTLSARYWSPSTIDRFVQLFLPLAVAAFLARAKSSTDFLICLLYMSPSIALPALLKCVDAGLNSPTEVVEHRRISTVLFTHIVITLFTDDEHFSNEVARSARETVASYLHGRIVTLISLISASTPEIAFSVLTLLSVAVNYIPTQQIMRSSYEAEALGTVLASRVIPFFTERSVEQGCPYATGEKHIEALISALLSSASTMMTRAVLREAQNCGYASRLTALVRMVAVVAPDEMWRCAEQTWLPVLHDLSAGDAEVEWAGTLLAACVSELGERQLVRAHAADVIKAVHVQLRFLTSKRRRGVAVQLTHALVASLMRPRWTAASLFRTTEWRRRADSTKLGVRSAEGTPLSSSLRATPEIAVRTGTATDARVDIEWPDPDEDVRVAVDFFNDALRELVQIITHAEQVRVCSPDVAAAVDTSSLSRRFLAHLDDKSHSSRPAAPSPAVEPRCVSESASAVRPHSVLDGALDWMLRLLEIFEWLYVEPSPPVAQAAAVDAVVAAAQRGVYWGDLNPRSALGAVRPPHGCRPAYSRAELFDVVYKHLCLPLIHHHVLTPLAKAGVELRPFFSRLLPLFDAFTAADSPLGIWKRDSVVDWSGVRGLVRWLVLCGIDCPQRFWAPRETLFRFWSKVTSGNPSCRVREKMPLNGWASRALQLSVEASVAGYLPVSQTTLTRTVSVLQCMSFSPHKGVRSSSLQLLVDDKLLASLDAASLALFAQRQHVLSMVMLTRWRALRDECRRSTEEEGSAVATSPSAQPFTLATAPSHALTDSQTVNAFSSSSSSTSRAAFSRTQLHTLQESTSGTFVLFTMMTIQNHFVKAPWWGLRAWRALVTFPEELRTMSTVRMLPIILKTYERSFPLGTVVSRSPLYLEELIQMASSLVAAHPTRTVALLTLANRLYWPCPQRWVSLHAVRLLTQLAVSTLVEVRSRATELLSAMAVHVSVREVRVSVYLLDSPQAGERARLPFSFLLSESGLGELEEGERQRHHAAVAALQASLQKLKAVLPMLPRYVKDKGQTFPVCTIAVPKSASISAGLPLLSREDFASPQGSFVEPPSFVNTLAGALPSDTLSYREQWSELLLGPRILTAGATGASPSAVSPSPMSLSLQAPSPSFPSTTTSSWALRVLKLPVERSLLGVVQEALPSTLVNLLASVHDGSAASTQRVAELLGWAERTLQEWENEQHTAIRRVETGNADLPTLEERPEVLSADFVDEVSVGGITVGAAGPRNGGDDEMYRLFLSVLTVTAAVVQLTSETAPESSAAAAANIAALRTRALRLFSSVLSCLCSHATVPHLIVQSMMALGTATVCEFLSVEETWTIVADVSEKLWPTPAEAAAAMTEQKKVEDTQVLVEKNSGDDLWSQRQLRLITIGLFLIQAVPLSTTAALLPRFVALVGLHGRIYFTSPVDQVRQSASRFISRLISMGSLHSSSLDDYKECYPAARQLLSALLERANTQAFQAKLPFTFAWRENREVNAEGVKGQRTTSSPFCSSAATDATTPLPVAALRTEDLALLTVVALSIQAIPIDVYLNFADDILILLCHCLDLSFTKTQHLHEAAKMALESLATSWMPKASAHHLLDHLCAICTSTVDYGISHRAKAACTRALRFVVFCNLHRIGKYAVMLRVGDAALAALADPSADVRSEGSQLFAILTKVASEAQTRVMVQAIASECRQLSKKRATVMSPSSPSLPPPHVLSTRAQLLEASSTSSSQADAEDMPTSSSLSRDPTNNRRIAVVQALGAVVLADPGTPSPYVPKLMEVLADFTREGNTECGRFAKRVFEQWWHAHREGWEQEYKKYFTAEQVDTMKDLLYAPRYYA